MIKPASRLDWVVWGVLALVLTGMVGKFIESRVNPPTREALYPTIGRVSPFTLTNQNNATVTLADLAGHPWIADVIFTRCPGPCVTMTRHLVDMQKELAEVPNVRFVTFTSDPEYDTPAMLARFISKFSVDSSRWSFLTGDVQQLRSLEVNDFRFVVVDKPPADRSVPADLFIHSTWFTLVDGQGNIHGWTDEQNRLHAYFDSEDSNDRARLVKTLKQWDALK